MSKTENNILLFSVTLCWSASYVFIKSLPPELSSFAYLTLTTGLAAIILLVIFWKQVRKITKEVVGKGFILSFILTINLLLEKRGIDLLPASNASFIAALTILVVPMFMLIFHVKLTANNMLGAGIIVLGLCLSSHFSMSGFINAGSLFMLLSCLSSAVYTIVVDRFAKQEEPLLISIVQMIFSACIGLILWYIEEPLTFRSLHYTNELLSSIFILAFFSKAYAYIILMYSQKYADPIRVTIIASTEPVVTLILAVLIPSAYGAKEKLTVSSLIGATVIAAGAVIAGTSFIKIRKKGGRKRGHTY